ncbi:RNA polymerase sigma factor SigL [Streptantibioticus cattleyicolor NRRL 8057 = DSM 46488]|uniref:RNA polymerase sigma factor SigL n=1 Tax=Streptantibioticus cattleyicolor (strain ATCC 35852 / DSM 46488 / JCM 4925 / NBRC 14057 / NRRL 8057) TaxID=1003195 RepID=F8K225_STREN|nr:RNA polymerase sigma factor SigL [Streptantibioticus cattleyicolor NRRL 8057 = DSM 46488]MYS58411.1 sigma-70 family RNA polymerase sigma factor [Streptomyces sp. SID5468]CCB74068.1 RNA polymerase sigma factor [Streptantibioticus cattleyicolor NRRL 8057 = DSM 46488]
MDGGRPSGCDPEEELMRALYREHAGALYAYVLRLVGGDRYAAEDVVQETLLRAWRNAARLSPVPGRRAGASSTRSLRPWLVTVARRVVIDGYRSRRVRPPEAGPAALEQIPAEDELDRALRLMTLSDALGELSEAHRQVLVETYFKGRTANEAAAELGVPPGTVRSRIFYALRSLRVALEERGVTS